MKLSLKYILSFVSLVVMQSVFGQEFSIVVSSKEIGKKDQVQVEYVINGTTRISNFIPPYLTKDWQILSGPSFSQMSSTINGRSQAVTKYVYLLIPVRSGDLKLPGTTVEADGKNLSCKDVSITVKKEDHLPGTPTPNNSLQLIDLMADEPRDDFASESILKHGENISAKVKKNLFVKASVSKKKCYVGEPILVTYKLYSRLNTRSRVVKQPNFSAATVVEMTTETDGIEKREVINGKTYRSYVIRKVQLLPLQAGIVTVGQTSVENNISFFSSPSSSRDRFYDAPRTEEHTVTISNDPINIEVMDLPATNENESFNGAVGKFQVFTRLKKDTIASNETNSLLVIVNGEGNFNSVNLPKIQWSKNMYHFDETVIEEVDKLQFPVSGKKIFEIPFECNEKGNLKMPAVTFTFFNPAKGKYETLETNPLDLIVKNATIQKTKGHTVAVKDSGLTPQYLFFLVPILFVIGGIIIAISKTKRRQGLTVTNSGAAVSTEIIETPKAVFNFSAEYGDLVQLQDDKEFYSKARGIASQMMEESTADKNVLAQLVKDCNEALYTPVNTTSKKEVLDKLQQAYNGDITL